MPMRLALRLFTFAALASLSTIAAACNKAVDGETSAPGPVDGQGDGGAGGDGDGEPGGDTDPSSVAPLGPVEVVFVRSLGDERDAHDVLVVLDLSSGDERVIADTAQDGRGWGIDGFSISPDRRRIVLASLYGPTAEDTATGHATQRIWTLDVEGKSLKRITPVFTSHAGDMSWWIDVRDPVFTSDGKNVIYDYGETEIGGKGFVRPWIVPADGSGLPRLFLQDEVPCSVVSDASANPVTGEVVLEYAVCNGQMPEGLHAHAPTGARTGVLVDAVRIWGPSRWAPDGRAFVFPGSANHDDPLSLYMMTPADGQLYTLVTGTEQKSILSAAVSPDASRIVYCAGPRASGSARDLRVLDLTKDPVTDAPLTADGRSCAPAF